MLRPPTQLSVAEVGQAAVSLIKGNGLLLRAGHFEVGTFEPEEEAIIKQFADMNTAVEHFNNEVKRLKSKLS